MKLRGLYAITPETTDSAHLEASVRTLFAAAANDCAALQYRNKSGTQAIRLDQARCLAALARASRVPFIVNDDVQLAVAVGADGVHIGRDDGDIGAARAALRGKLVGVSCYDDLATARSAVTSGADYVAFGSVFPSNTKPQAVRAPLALFRAAKALGVPLVAIGGITAQNAPAVLDAGADALAVISALFDAPDIAARAREFARLFATRSGATA
jgi:thiamine-phosphate pyrophosphorylase